MILMNKYIIHTFILLIAIFAFNVTAFAQAKSKKLVKENVNVANNRVMENKMKVEIWSDVMCPFCYLGKRNFEKALEQFEDRNFIEVVWKSYQLDASIPEVAKESYEEYLVIRKGMSVTQVKQTLQNLTESVKKVGLVYDFDKSVMVNSLSAHKLIQFAKTKGKGNEAEEVLFRAFFTEGKNIADLKTLTQLGKEIGLDETELQTAFTDSKYAALVEQDILEAQQVGVQGVPFFVIDRKYAVSGAQPSDAFLANLEKAFKEWRKLNPISKLEIIQGQSCTPKGICE